MVNYVGEGNYPRTIHHLLVGRYRPGQRSLCLCWDVNEGKGEEALAVAWPGWFHTGSADALFFPQLVYLYT